MMAHMMETMAYAGEVPWHGLGKSVAGNLTPEEMLIEAGLDWTVSKQPLYTARVSGEYTFYEKVPDRMALVRDSDGSVLTIVGKVYKPVQNADAMDFFSEFAKAGSITMETAGSLKGGKHIWALAKLDTGFTLGKTAKKSGDDVEGYVLLNQPHVHGYATSILATGVRVVCWNTLTMALQSRSSNGKVFHMRHSGEGFTTEMKASAARAVGLATKQFTDFGEAAKVLAAKTIKAGKLEEYFGHLVSFDREAAELKAAEKGKDEIKLPKVLTDLLEAYETSPGSDLAAARGTYWGALNAVTYVVDHKMGRDRSNALHAAWLGQGAVLKRQALDLALAA